MQSQRVLLPTQCNNQFTDTSHKFPTINKQWNTSQSNHNTKLSHFQPITSHNNQYSTSIPVQLNNYRKHSNAHNHTIIDSTPAPYLSSVPINPAHEFGHRSKTLTEFFSPGMYNSLSMTLGTATYVC